MPKLKKSSNCRRYFVILPIFFLCALLDVSVRLMIIVVALLLTNEIAVFTPDYISKYAAVT